MFSNSTKVKSMADYYNDLAASVKLVRASVPNADSDAAFAKAARVIDQLVDLCRNIETVEATEARDINEQRKAILNNLGSDRLIDVQGEASKALAQKYAELLQGLYDKKYYPVSTCPASMWVYGPSYDSEYDKHFEDRTKPSTKKAIDKQKSRISAYENTAHAAPRP